jgi:hypothetical protein
MRRQGRIIDSCRIGNESLTFAVAFRFSTATEEGFLHRLTRRDIRKNSSTRWRHAWTLEASFGQVMPTREPPRSTHEKPHHSVGAHRHPDRRLAAVRGEPTSGADRNPGERSGWLRSRMGFGGRPPPTPTTCGCAASSLLASWPFPRKQDSSHFSEKRLSPAPGRGSVGEGLLGSGAAAPRGMDPRSNGLFT